MTGRVGRAVIVVGAVIVLATFESSRAEQAGTGTIAGVITTNDAQPLHAAVVTLSASSVSGATIKAVTDDEGRFAASGLAPDNYQISVSKPAYITTDYGATRIGESGTPIALGAGQQLTNVAIRVPRGAVITGTVFDLDGAPVPNLLVSVFPGAGVDLAVTDDRGVYRIFGLKPDDYVVAANPRATVSGGSPMMSTSAVDAALAELERTHGRGAGPIAGPAGAPGGRRASAPVRAPAPAAPRYSLAQVFYPGTISREQATAVTVREGEERSGIDFSLMLSGTTKISGVILAPDGQPAIGSALTGVAAPSATPTTATLPSILTNTSLAVTINPRVATAIRTAGLWPSMSTNQKDSTFVATNLTPGAYTIMARVVAPRPVDASAAPATPVRPTTLWALADIDVGTTDITGVTMTLKPAMTMTGRVVFDRSTLAPPTDLTRIRIGLSRLAPAPGESAEAPVVTTTRADGTFEVGGIIAGNYQLTATLPAQTPAGWRLRSAMHNGHDLLDEPPALGRDTALDLRGIVITFTDKHTELAGRLETSSGTPAPSHFIVAFPADRQLWQPLSRRLVFTRPATDGSFSITDLPPGDYLVAALTDLDTATWRRTEFLRQLVPASVKVTIRDSGRTTQDLRIAR